FNGTSKQCGEQRKVPNRKVPDRSVLRFRFEGERYLQGAGVQNRPITAAGLIVPVDPVLTKQQNYRMLQ
ncbi:MAG: hypothetical protein ABSC60_06685, partial [Acidobacteriota bacterium]